MAHDQPDGPDEKDNTLKGADPYATRLPASGAPAWEPPPPGIFTDGLQLSGYEVIGILGRGGMGVVYKARQLSLKRLVALKMILSESAPSSAELARFKREAEVVAQFQHPNIVQIYDIGDHAGRPFFAMEFAEGGTLAQKLAGTPQRPVDAAQLVLTLAQALSVMHRRGIIHRDLKPGNILLFADGIPKISDFGLVKQTVHDRAVTPSGQLLGTPSYMSPEQAAGQRIGPSSDIHALGAILYELLTGRPPFLGVTYVDTVQQIIHQDPVPPSRLQPSVPAQLEAICLKCLEKTPSRRYPTALALAADLECFLQGKRVQAKRPSAWRRGVNWLKRRPVAAALLVGGLLALLGIAGGGWGAYALKGDPRAAIFGDQPVISLAEAEAAERAAEARLLEAKAAADRYETELTAQNEKVRIMVERVKLAENEITSARDSFAQNLGGLFEWIAAEERMALKVREERDARDDLDQMLLNHPSLATARAASDLGLARLRVAMARIAEGKSAPGTENVRDLRQTAAMANLQLQWAEFQYAMNSAVCQRKQRARQQRFVLSCEEAHDRFKRIGDTLEKALKAGAKGYKKSDLDTNQIRILDALNALTDSKVKLSRMERVDSQAAVDRARADLNAAKAHLEALGVPMPVQPLSTLPPFPEEELHIPGAEAPPAAAPPPAPAPAGK
jgi:predicted Ser/Thr protein kinase